MSSYYCQKCKHRLLALDADCIVCQQAEQITAIKAEVNRLRTIVDNESNMPLKQEKAYSNDCKKQLAGTRAIVNQQAEQIGAMHTTIQCMADTLRERDELIKQLEYAKTQLLQMNTNQTELLEERDEEIKELLLADTKNTEIVERLMKEAEGVSEDAWDSLKRKIQQLEAQLIQANLDIIRLGKRNEGLKIEIEQLSAEMCVHRVNPNCTGFNYCAISELSKSNQSKFSG